MTIEANTAADLDLLALMVARHLRDRRAERAPARSDYAIAKDGRYGEGRPDVHVQVDLGRGLQVRVEGSWITPAWDDLERLTNVGGDLADTIERVVRAATETRDMMREVRTAAKRHVAKANRRGLPWRLIAVEPCPVTSPGGGEEPMATITLEIVGETPVPALTSFDACCSEDLNDELDRLLEKQLELACRWRTYALAGATGAIDATVHADLVAAGHDMPALLRQLAESESWVVDVVDATGRQRVLHWTKGVVHGTVRIGDDAFLHEGLLTFKSAPSWIGKSVRGRELKNLISHPSLGAAVTIRSVSGDAGGFATVWCTVPTLLFDTRTGRVWEADRQALAA